MWRLRKKTGTELSLPTGETVRVYLDADVDAATIVVSDEPVARTERIEGFGLVDLDADGNLVALELLGVTQQIEEWRRIRQEAAPDEPNLVEELRASASRLVDEARGRVFVG